MLPNLTVVLPINAPRIKAPRKHRLIRLVAIVVPSPLQHTFTLFLRFRQLVIRQGSEFVLCCHPTCLAGFGPICGHLVGSDRPNHRRHQDGRFLRIG